MKSSLSLSPSIGVRRRSDPRSSRPSTSSPIASPSKKQRLLLPHDITPAAAAPRSRPTAAGADTPKSNLLAIAIDTLSSSFLYLDVGDVPSAAVTCKDWNAALKTVEDELWLGLVRKHCPVVEEVTKLLKLPTTTTTTTASEQSGDCGPPGAKTDTCSSSNVPVPSCSWRSQFQRHVLLNKSDEADASARVKADKPPPKPLSSYLFQVDLVLHKAKEGVPGKGDRVGVVTRVFDDIRFNNIGRIGLEMDQLGEEMTLYEFSTFDVRITLYDRATGRQAIVHNSSEEDWWDSNLWFFGFGRICDAYKLEGFGTSDTHRETISTMLTTEKTGCVANCLDDSSWDFFSKPSCKNCCKCDKKWSCFWDMTLEMWIVADFEWDIVDMDKEQQLRVLEELVDFK